MTEERLALSELLEKSGEGDFLCAVAEAVLQPHTCSVEPQAPPGHSDHSPRRVDSGAAGPTRDGRGFLVCPDACGEGLERLCWLQMPFAHWSSQEILTGPVA